MTENVISNKIENQTYTDMKVSIDNVAYENCTFDKCIVEYSGLGPVALVGCTFNNCKWAFAGPAQNTINFMQMMYHNMGDFGVKTITATFENIKNKKMPNLY